MNSTWSRYYDVVKKISSLAGQWPYQNRNTRLLCVSLITLSTFTLNGPQIAKFIKCNGNMQCIFETMTSIMLATISLVKLFTCYLNRYNMKILADHLFVDWNTLECSKEYKIMEKYAESSRRYSLGYSLYCLTATYLFMSISFIPQLLDFILPLNESRPILMTYPGYYFVDEEKYFFYIFSHSVVSWEIAMTALIAHDCMFMTYVEHVCSLFAVVGFRFEHLMYSRSEKEKLANADLDVIYKKKIAVIVHTHRKAVKYVQLLESTFTIPFAIQILIIVITMSVTLLQIAQNNDNSNILELIRYVLYIIGELIHLFVLSFEGQKIIDHGIEIRNKIYNSFWYKVSKKSQQLLILVMMRTLQLSFLTAGKMYIFSLESFMVVLQASMSYCTVLANFQ